MSFNPYEVCEVIVQEGESFEITVVYNATFQVLLTYCAHPPNELNLIL